MARARCPRSSVEAGQKCVKLKGARLSLIGDETVISLQRAKVYVFSDSVLCQEESINILSPTKLGKKG